MKNIWNLCALAFFIAIIMLSCVKEKQIDDHDTGIDQSAGIQLKFTTETMKFIKVIGDEAALEDSERAVLIPERGSSTTTFSMDTSGNIYGEVIFLSNEIDYPDNTIGRILTPEYLKVAKFSFDNNTVNYYDDQEALIESAPSCAELVSYYQLLANEIYSHINFTAEEFSWFISGWEDAGYTVDDYGDNLHVVNIPLSNGGLHKMVIDNELQAVVGSSFFDASGSMLTSSSISIDGTVSNPNRIVHQFTTNTKMPLSQVDVELVYQSTMENIVIDIN